MLLLVSLYIEFVMWTLHFFFPVSSRSFCFFLTFCSWIVFSSRFVVQHRFVVHLLFLCSIGSSPSIGGSRKFNAHFLLNTCCFFLFLVPQLCQYPYVPLFLQDCPGECRDPLVCSSSVGWTNL